LDSSVANASATASFDGAAASTILVKVRSTRFDSGSKQWWMMREPKRDAVHVMAKKISVK
jgi:hypothetical protein